MYIALGILFLSIIVWLLSAFTLEMLGWRTHRQVWLASLLFFIANVNLLRSIVMGYSMKITASSAPTGDNSTIQKMKAS
jgi:phosphatidylinositol glycan class M